MICIWYHFIIKSFLNGTGTQGRAPDPFWDPLGYLIEKSHGLGIEVHGWFNPYRARAGSTSHSGLAPTHMANRFPRYAYAYGNNLWMDPGAEDVQAHLITVFTDVVRRYDIDGVHMDDYFYPYPVSSHDFPDSLTYDAYKSKGGTLSLQNWRRENINNFVLKLNKELHAIKPYIKFGISPFGIWKPGHPAGIRGLSAYDSLYADSRKWLMEGWVDYLAPQLYWKIEPPAQSYPALLNWWLQQNSKNRHVYAGNDVARVVSNGWDVQEIINQIKISRSNRDSLSLGNIQFSMKYFVRNSHGLADAFKELYASRSLTPEMHWMNVTIPVAPKDVSATSNLLTWSGDHTGVNMYWAIYKQVADTWNLVHVVLAKETSISSLTEGSYAIRGVNRVGLESKAVTAYIYGTQGVPVG